MKNIKEIVPLLWEWAGDKGLLFAKNAPKQYEKFLEEVGETAKAILKNDVPEIKDGFGDIAVTIVIYYKQLGLSLSLDFDPSPRLSDKPFEVLFQEMYHETTTTLDYLNDICSHYGYDLEECVNLAWNTIKSRKGKTENGIFTKDS